MPGVDIKKDDNVQVMSGKDRGKRGRVVHVLPARGPRDGRGRRRGRRSTRAPRASAPASGQQLQQGGIIDTELFIDISNVQLVCKTCGKPTRVGHRIEGDGSKVRICRKCEAELTMAEPATTAPASKERYRRGAPAPAPAASSGYRRTPCRCRGWRRSS